MNLAAVIVAVIFVLVYTVPTLREASQVETCAQDGGRWLHAENLCVMDN